ncbi:MAG: YggT family protein [Fusobacteria bacterium]|nr:YggT family protein [Fusobacteriota bacterium]
MRIFFLLLERSLRIIETLLIIRIILSWVLPGNFFYSMSRGGFSELLSDLVKAIYKVTDPILKPFRIIIPLGGAMLDIGPIVVFFIIRILRGILAFLA